MSGKNIARIIFWSLFLPAAVVAGVIFYRHGTENKIDRYMEEVAHPNAAVASEAWIQLQDLYLTSWRAYDVILSRVDDDRPISFLIEKVKVPDPGKPAKLNFSAEGKPIYYKADTVYCRTVGEAILAFVHNEPKWKTEFDGDWKVWWEKNKGYYGR